MFVNPQVHCTYSHLLGTSQETFMVLLKMNCDEMSNNSLRFTAGRLHLVNVCNKYIHYSLSLLTK